jgi:hypothetical protein
MPSEPEFGVPQVDVHKRTTKVNFAMMAALLLFLVAGGIVFYVVWQRT